MLSQFAHELKCLYCGKANPATEWRALGDFQPFYCQAEPGRFNLTMTCPHCQRVWYVAWDDDPGPLQKLPFAGQIEQENDTPGKKALERITIYCRSCGRSATTARSNAGKLASCSGCKALGKIPDATKTIRFQCHGCMTTFAVSESAAGKSSVCPKCGTAVTVPHVYCTRIEELEPGLQQQVKSKQGRASNDTSQATGRTGDPGRRSHNEEEASRPKEVARRKPRRDWGSKILAFFLGSEEKQLTRAARRGSHKRVQELLRKGVCPNSPAVDGCTPLIAAARAGHDSVCRILLEAGADINARDEQGFTAVSRATIDRKSVV